MKTETGEHQVNRSRYLPPSTRKQRENRRLPEPQNGSSYIRRSAIRAQQGNNGYDADTMHLTIAFWRTGN